MTALTDRPTITTDPSLDRARRRLLGVGALGSAVSMAAAATVAPGKGRSNAEVAQALWISEATVKSHLNRVLAKTGLRDRAQVVVLAYESGLVAPGSASS